MSIFNGEIFEEIIHNLKNFTNYNIFMNFVKNFLKNKNPHFENF